MLKLLGMFCILSGSTGLGIRFAKELDLRIQELSELQKLMILLKGEITSPIDPAPGCRFAARCVYAKEKCFKENPRYREIQNGHRAACHYVEEINHMKEEEKP